MPRRSSPPPCGEGSGVGVGRCATALPQPPEPPPQPSPTRGEGAREAPAQLNLTPMGSPLPYVKETGTSMTMVRRLSRWALAGTVVSVAIAVLLPLRPPGLAAADEAPREAPNKITSNGISVEFAARAGKQDGDTDKIVAGQDVEVRFKLTDRKSTRLNSSHTVTSYA